MTKRPTLDALSSRLSAKPALPSAGPAQSPIDVDDEAIDQNSALKQKRGAQADGRKGVLLRLKPEAWIQLKGMAAQQTLDRSELFSMQAALEEALNDWFRKHGKPPIA